MRKATVATYTPVLSQVMESTEKTGEQLNDYYEKIRQAIDQKKVNEMVPAEFDDIVLEFNDGTDTYRQNLTKLQKVAVPARFIGKHKLMVAAYEEYVRACEAMVASLDVKERTADVAKFDQAEKDQETAMDHVSKAMMRILSTAR